LVLLLIPAAAIAVYAVLHALRLAPPTNMMLYVITMPLGFWFFGRSLWVILRHTDDERDEDARIALESPAGQPPNEPADPGPKARQDAALDLGGDVKEVG
jgi:hypothetical protein